MEPTAERMRFPEGYGNPTATIRWSDVRTRLTDAEHYWLVTARPGGAPHAVPTDGIWHDDHFYFGGHADTVHIRNLGHDSRVVLHLEDAMNAVIVEGDAEWMTPSSPDAESLAASSKAKYGWGSTADGYRAGVWRIVPRRVMAWNALRDATRFTF